MHGRRLAGVLMGLAVLTGCSATESNSNSSSAGRAAAPEVLKPAQGGGGNAPQQQPPQQQTPQQEQISQPGVDRKLIRTANLDLEAPDVVDVTNKARGIAADLGGFAGKEDVKNDSATLTLHIPSNQFDKALDELSKIVPNGVKSRSQTAEDVTEQLVDVDSRITTQRASVQRIRDLLAKAQTVNEIVQIESEVTRREADLESLEKRRESLNGQVALSTVTLRVSKGAPAPPPAAQDNRSGFVAGLTGGWNAFTGTGAVVLRVLGAVLPFLIVLGPLGYFGLRWWRRRQRPMTVES